MKAWGVWVKNKLSLFFPTMYSSLLVSIICFIASWIFILGITASWFPWYVRIARSQSLVISSLDYVSISKSMGAGKLHIIKKHILPNSIYPILTQASIDAGYAILTSAGLSFIGLGAQHPDVEWGLLITQSRAHFLSHWWEVFFPGVFLCLTVMCFNIIGDEISQGDRK